MRLALEWRRRASTSTDAVARVVEVITPRTNAAALSSAEHLFASLARSELVSLEMAADCNRRRFLVRTAGEHTHQQLRSQLGAAYPQAELRRLPADQDPALTRQGEQVGACLLRLRGPVYLPLRTFTDLDVDGEHAAQADPLPGLLSALGELPPGWRALSQIVLHPAPEDWGNRYQRLAVQHPLEHERVVRAAETGRPMLAFVGLLLGMLVLGLRAHALWQSGQWLQLIALVTAALVVGSLVIALVRRFGRRRLYDMDLVRQKVSRLACRAEVRLVVHAPAEVARSAIDAHLSRIAAAYRRYDLATANGLVPRPVQARRAGASVPRAWGPRRRLPILTTLELAGLWHLPHRAADVALLERTTARHWLPRPLAVVDGCQIGISRQQGHEVPVALPADLLRRHVLLVAKTRRGKSTLMQRLARFCAEAEPRRTLLLIDPHRDLAEGMLGLVPASRAGDVVFLDVADRARPFGLNLLDCGLGWDRDRVVANALTVFQREFGDRYWGPRMEDVFRFALLSLFDANVAMTRADPVQGRRSQYTLLDVPAICSDSGFRREVLNAASDPGVRAWWTDYFEPLDRRFQLELVNPVLSKIHRFEGSGTARDIVGQPASTIDPAGWLRDGAIVIVNTARGIVGDNAAGLIGGTLLNLVTLAVAEQARLQPGARFPVSLFVDEFHTIPGADYETILAELSKYGANLVLATQSLARLLAIGGEDGRGLRSIVFANIDGLFAFNCSAEDAEYLVAELGGALDQQDLVELGEHECYARVSAGGQRLPTFWVHLDPPLVGDAGRGAALARASAERYGRPARLVDADRRAALARRLQSRTPPAPAAAVARRAAREPASSAAATRAAGEPAPPAAAAPQHPRPAPGPDTSPPRPARNQHRPRKKRRQTEGAGV